jgi:hypothetical protein
MTYLYQHAVLFGIGYKSGLTQGLHWGFQITTGPMWYGARFDELPTENRFQGTVEGRVNAGLRAGALEYGLSVGYASPYKIRDRGASTEQVGGVLAGVYIDWL